eukprot:605495-Rhodomonas_salina.2
MPRVRCYWRELGTSCTLLSPYACAMPCPLFTYGRFADVRYDTHLYCTDIGSRRTVMRSRGTNMWSRGTKTCHAVLTCGHVAGTSELCCKHQPPPPF